LLCLIYFQVLAYLSNDKTTAPTPVAIKSLDLSGYSHWCRCHCYFISVGISNGQVWK